MSQTVTILEGALELISDGGWCQRSWARDRRGRETGYYSPDARSWCAIGAVDAVAHHFHASSHEALGVLHEAARAMGCQSADTVNDRSTPLRVYEMFERAVMIAEARGRRDRA